MLASISVFVVDDIEEDGHLYHLDTLGQSCFENLFSQYCTGCFQVFVEFPQTARYSIGESLGVLSHPGPLQKGES